LLDFPRWTGIWLASLARAGVGGSFASAKEFFP